MSDIKHGHVHHMIPVGERTLADGAVEYQLRCQTRIVEDDEGKLVESHAGCQLEQRVRFNEDGSPRDVAYRFGGVWFDALFLARLQPMPSMECEQCHADGDCPACGSLGLVRASGGKFQMPQLKVIS